ncbi:MAG: nuclear transport factor 2 family protein [Gemmatimonadaceae bacterium]
MPSSPVRHYLALAVAATVVIGLRSGDASAQTSGKPTSAADSAAVAQTMTSFHEALAAGDSAGALALLTPDATILESGGTESRAEYRSHHLPADIEFARAVESVRGPIRVSVLGDVAWASATSTAQGDFRGRAVRSAGAELMVLTRVARADAARGASWQINAIHWSSRTIRP